MKNPIIFISYSIESIEHNQFALRLCNSLRKDGMDCIIDQYVNGFPPEGWPRWTELQIASADFVLIICTESYLCQYMGVDSVESGRRVNFEGAIISQTLYQNDYYNKKFIPILPPGGNQKNIPLPLRQFKFFEMMGGYESLYRFITDQPLHEVPLIGNIRSPFNINSVESKLDCIFEKISNRDLSLLTAMESSVILSELDDIKAKEFSNLANILWLIVFYESNKIRVLSQSVEKKECSIRRQIEPLDEIDRKFIERLLVKSLKSKLLIGTI